MGIQIINRCGCGSRAGTGFCGSTEQVNAKSIKPLNIAAAPHQQTLIADSTIDWTLYMYSRKQYPHIGVSIFLFLESATHSLAIPSALAARCLLKTVRWVLGDPVFFFRKCDLPVLAVPSIPFLMHNSLTAIPAVHISNHEVISYF